MKLVEPATLAWAAPRIGEALIALARHCGLTTANPTAARNPPERLSRLDRWLAAAGAQCGVAVESLSVPTRDVAAALAAIEPVLVRIPDGVLAVVSRRRGALRCLGPDGTVGWTARRAVAERMQRDHEAPHLARITALLDRAGLAGTARARAQAGMLGELLAQTQVLYAWQLRVPPSAAFAHQARAAGLFRVAGALVAAYAAQFLLFLLSWWAIGAAALQGHLASGWLWAWALTLLAGLPLVVISTASQGKLAVGAGLLLRRRLLAGALELSPRAINREGIGQLLGRVIEADSLERVALGGGIRSLLAVLELAIAGPVFAMGAGGWRQTALLAGWLVLGAALTVRLSRARYRWTDQRLALTALTVERIVGHRTRLAQELPERWHDGEDATLAGYLDHSEHLDRRTLALLVVLPRAWLIASLATLVPAFVRGASPASLGVGVGGAVLAWQSFGKLAAGLDQLATAYVAWRRVAPIFRAAASAPPGEPAAPSRTTRPEYLIAPPAIAREPVLEAIDIAYRHASRATDVLASCNLVIRRGDRILLQGASGSGKSTFASLLTGMQAPRSGLLLARGLDMSCLGEAGWRARIAAAPQFHDNHVLTESFAFNVLMGRGWPPRPGDVDTARAVCEELGLGPLIARMPDGMFQTIGETGWQLSHGEKSRLFIARALLQGSDLVILDESLAALDPETMAATLRCVRARAATLVVIAHP